VNVRHHDTQDVESGFGSFASRSTVVAGNAVAAACRALRDRAAEALGVDAAALELSGGSARAGGRELALADLGAVTGRFEKAHPSYAFGASLSVVSVEPATGRVTPLRHVVAHDVGRAVNPALVEGQLAGAAVQGIAGALYEELPYDELGQPLATTLADYRLPHRGRERRRRECGCRCAGRRRRRGARAAADAAACQRSGPRLLSCVYP
jgi:carbon-monoxide dehydrogenase large subunit